jgi:hypothetical protein
MTKVSSDDSEEFVDPLKTVKVETPNPNPASWCGKVCYWCRLWASTFMFANLCVCVCVCVCVHAYMRIGALGKRGQGQWDGIGVII